MDYTDIISAANYLYSLGMLLEFASFLWLRRKFSIMKRPYRVPFKLSALVPMRLIPTGFLVVKMAILMTVVGILWYFLMRFCKSKEWLKQWRKCPVELHFNPAILTRVFLEKYGSYNLILAFNRED
ncbi:putative polyamine transporter [Abeliophyllum distichum]|uniref:Polyamine transporter n=1 Tax=Abeliophyllum distichum TaxID=126358 RepID=A0ABD1SZW3_9LAMI